jgi:hypothetical protein
MEVHMASCEWCGGLGRVGAGGITGRFADLFGPSGGSTVRDCGRCGGTRRIGEPEPDPLPRQRTASPGLDLPGTLPGAWLVEVHGSGRILVVIRFQLTGTSRFEARCEYGGPLGWQARGEWTTLDPGDTIRLSGTQSTPYLPATGYRWGVALDRLSPSVLHGASLTGEWTMWSRQAGPIVLSGQPEPVRADAVTAGSGR